MIQTEITDTMRELKRRFFMMRNGAIGEQLRRNGLKYRIIFGLNMPQLIEIAGDFPVDRDFALALWANTSTRESMLMAPMLYPAEQLTLDDALKLAGESPSVEVTDNLCHRLLRKAPFVEEIINKCLTDKEERPLMRYCGLRLLRGHLTEDNIDSYRPRLEAEVASSRPTSGTARIILAEWDW